MLKGEELVATGRNDCATMTIRAMMPSTADDAEHHRSSSLTLSQWLLVLRIYL